MTAPVDGFYPNGIAHLQPTIHVAVIEQGGAKLVVPSADLGSVVDNFIDDDGEIYTLTFKVMTRTEFDALGEFDGF